MPFRWTKQDKFIFLAKAKFFSLDDPYLFKYCPDKITTRCVFDDDFHKIISLCHDQSCGGHFSSKKTTAKTLQCEFYWPSIFVIVMSIIKLMKSAKD